MNPPFEYPEFIKGFPEIEIPIEGIRGFLLQSDNGQVVFFESEVEASIPPHSHGNQWGIMVDGKLKLRIGDNAPHVYEKGENYFVPAGVEHEATVYPGFKVVDFFADTDRYEVKK